ncbi:MAG TPA: hypothetical protein VFD58_19330 [Blastocatellia bacterium]|nr:hypothetical protein [Blastocatellia bacterium]
MRCRPVLVCALVLLGSLATLAQDHVPDKAALSARAQELLRQSRMALGGEDALGKVQSLSASGKLRQFMKYAVVTSPTEVRDREKTVSGKVEVDFLFPDRFRKQVSSSTLTGFGYTYAEVLNGDRAWRNPPLPPQTSQKDRRVIDVSDVTESYARQAETARAQISFYTLGWLLRTPPSFPVELIYAGQVDYENRPADAILVGNDAFRPLLLLDQKTHLPLAIVFSYVEAPRETVIVEVASVSARYIRDTYLKARQERKARAKPPQRQEMHLRFSDHRQVAGVLLPHRLTVVLNGRVIEELEIRDFEINRPINPKKFEGQPEEKY